MTSHLVLDAAFGQARRSAHVPVPYQARSRRRGRRRRQVVHEAFVLAEDGGDAGSRSSRSSRSSTVA